MTDENLFQYLLSRVQTRESSTLGLATIASSASLILFGIYFSFNIDEQIKNVVWWLGLLLPIIGFTYFEVTFATQQSWDYKNILKQIKKDLKNVSKEELKKIILGENRVLVFPKEILWRILLALPIIGWVSSYDNQAYMLYAIIGAAVAIFLLILRIERKKSKLKFDEDNKKKT